ncbi:MAG: peptide-methionine (R)-S-oxide reductase MsrB [Myxococcota bacterium]|nr:peptide-methionine (R)-S-oxide reductase MsrB [Myxococcota bacterium]
MDKIVRSEDEWRAQLGEAAFQVTRHAGTEPPYSGALYQESRVGTYHCVCCGLALFRSDTKFDAGCGWPSFWEPLEGAHLVEHVDRSHGMTRTEVTCRRCDAHLGHVFPDGPPPTGLRYCINSVCLNFDNESED